MRLFKLVISKFVIDVSEISIIETEGFLDKSNEVKGVFAKEILANPLYMLKSPSPTGAPLNDLRGRLFKKMSVKYGFPRKSKSVIKLSSK